MRIKLQHYWHKTLLVASIGLAQISCAHAADKLQAMFSSSIANGQVWAIYVAAQAKGIMEKHGIALEFSEGQGGGFTAQVLSSRKVDVGLGLSASSVISVNGQGGKLFMLGQDAPLAQIAVLSKPPVIIEKPSDLVGKRIGVPPGTSQALAWPGFLKRNKIDPASIKVVNVQLATMRAALLSDQLDGYLSYASSNLPLLRSAGVADPRAMLFADFGFRISPDAGIVVHESMLKERPDLARRLMAAMEEAYESAFADPQAAAKAAVAMYPAALKYDIVVGRIEGLRDEFKAAGSKEKPLLQMRLDAWEDQLSAMKEMQPDLLIKQPSEYFTNDFLPRESKSK